MKLALVGATGLVGGEILRVLEEMSFPVTELIPVASEKSVGNTVDFRGKPVTVVSAETALSLRPQLAIFSAGATSSKALAPLFAEIGCTVVDNSSAWRMEPGIPLIVPEVNWGHLNGSRIIANPNCSTIQMVVALAPLHAAFGIKRLVISTYQSVTGTGKAAVDQLFGERENRDYKQIYPTRIDLNCIPQCDVFLENGYTKEEMKLVNETRKILGEPSLRITSTTVRVPVIGGHSEAVNIEFEKPFTVEQVREILSGAPGVIVQDDPATLTYPTPRSAHGKNEVFVGRIRRDESLENGLNLWIVADNLRKGAATNAVQIALKLLETEGALA
jgi:aspartate-semialdehyde dehydrogenase